MGTPSNTWITPLEVAMIGSIHCRDQSASLQLPCQNLELPFGELYNLALKNLHFLLETLGSQLQMVDSPLPG